MIFALLAAIAAAVLFAAGVTHAGTGHSEPDLGRAAALELVV